MLVLGAGPGPRQTGLQLTQTLDHLKDLVTVRLGTGGRKHSRHSGIIAVGASSVLVIATTLPAVAAQEQDRIAEPLEVACEGDIPAMVLIVEVTIPGLFDRREFTFPLRPVEPPESGGAIRICAGGHSENGDGFDPSGQLATYYGASAYIEDIRADSARVWLSFYWKTSEGKGDFDRTLSVPLFKPKMFEFRRGIVVRTHRGK